MVRSECAQSVISNGLRHYQNANNTEWMVNTCSHAFNSAVEI